MPGSLVFTAAKKSEKNQPIQQIPVTSGAFQVKKRRDIKFLNLMTPLVCRKRGCKV